MSDGYALRRLEKNDSTLTKLQLGGRLRHDDITNWVMFNSRDSYNFNRLGAAIGENTHLTDLVVVLSIFTFALDVSVTGFFDGLKRNSSIHKLDIKFSQRVNAGNVQGGDTIRRLPLGGVGQKILEAYQENNNLTELSINNANLKNGGEHIIAQTLRRCTNLKRISLSMCIIINDDQTWSYINDGQLLPIVEAVRGHRSLKILDLNNNRIGNAGCETIATLLRDSNSNINHIDLRNNDIDNEGVTTLANALLNNTKLRIFNLHGNPVDQDVVDNFNKLLCNVSSIDSIYSSNHILENLGPSILLGLDLKLTSLLKMNKGKNKSHVAIKKILKYHPNIDMEPLFEWNMEGDGERDLKALPYVVAWFDRAGEAVASDEGEDSYNIDGRKLSALYQFALAMPLLFVPTSHIEGVGTTQKKGDN